MQYSKRDERGSDLKESNREGGSKPAVDCGKAEWKNMEQNGDMVKAQNERVHMHIHVYMYINV